MNQPTTTTESAKPTSIPITDLLPGELFRMENDPRLVRLVRIDEPAKDNAGFVRITIGALANSQSDRGAMFSASTRVVPAWL